MNHVIIRTSADTATLAALLDATRVALAGAGRVDVFALPAAEAISRAFARDWADLHVHPAPVRPTWREVCTLALHVGATSLLVADAAALAAPDALDRLLGAVIDPSGPGLVAPLLLSRAGQVVEAGRLESAGAVVALGTGDEPDEIDYTCDRHVDTCSMTLVAMPSSSLAFVSELEDEAAVAPALWMANRAVVVTPCAAAVVALGLTEWPGAQSPELRRMADRRHRAGQQIMIGASRLSNSIVEFATALSTAGQHVTFAPIRGRGCDADAWGRTAAARLGVACGTLDRGDDVDPAARLRALLRRRRYDVALLWAPPSGRWFLPRIHAGSPGTRVVARVPRGWQDRVARHLLAGVQRRWMSSEALQRQVAPA